MDETTYPKDTFETNDEINESGAPKHPEVDHIDVMKSLRDAIAEHNELVKEVQYRTQNAAAQPAPAQDPQVLERQIQELNQRFLSNPAEFLATAIANLKASIVDELKRSMTQEVDSKTFWEGFFKDYPELIGFNDVIQQVINDDAKIIAGMRRQDMAKHVAGKTRKILEERLEAIRKANSQKEAPTGMGLGAGALTWPTQTRASGAEAKVQSLSEALKELRRKQYS